MITDRTASDVSNFIVYRNIIGNGGSITDEATEIMLRGSLNNVTLNRIDSKTKELADLLNSLSYTVNVDTIIYTNDYIFSIIDVYRTLNNINNLRRAYFVYTNTPETPDNMYHYIDINNIEKILVDIEKILDNMISGFLHCGTINCGEV